MKEPKDVLESLLAQNRPTPSDEEQSYSNSEVLFLLEDSDFCKADKETKSLLRMNSSTTSNQAKSVESSKFFKVPIAGYLSLYPSNFLCSRVIVISFRIHYFISIEFLRISCDILSFFSFFSLVNGDIVKPSNSFFTSTKGPQNGKHDIDSHPSKPNRCWEAVKTQLGVAAFGFK